MIYFKKIHILIGCVILAAGGVLGCCLHSGNLRYADGNVRLSRHTVIIDAGHGGKDAGTIGIDGTPEKDVNLAIAKVLYDYLCVCGIRAALTRSDDAEVYPADSDRSRSDLYNRMDFINSFDNAVLVSVHQNHFDDEKEWGTQIWYSANTPESQRIADAVLGYTKKFLQPENRRENKQSDNSYYLLYQAKAPSVMVECGFMSNRAENARLQQEDYQKQIAFTILLGLCKEI